MLYKIWRKGGNFFKSIFYIGGKTFTFQISSKILFVLRQIHNNTETCLIICREREAKWREDNRMSNGWTCSSAFVNCPNELDKFIWSSCDSKASNAISYQLWPFKYTKLVWHFFLIFFLQSLFYSTFILLHHSMR